MLCALTYSTCEADALQQGLESRFVAQAGPLRFGLQNTTRGSRC